MITSKFKKLLALAVVAAVTSSTFFSLGASAAWKQDSTGWWNTEGNSYSVGWKAIDGAWYYFDSTGYMKTGWIKDGSAWYYLQPSGAMKTGWLLDNGAWYYLSESGSMKTGLVDVNGKTYYLSDSGAMKTGNVTINGVNYTFASSGEKLTVNNATTNTTATTTADTTTSTTNSTSVSSGSGGSGGSSSNSSSTSSKTHYYESLFGTWTLGDCVSSSMNTKDKLTTADINLALGGNTTFVISSSKISIGSSYSSTDPTFKDGTMTSSQFKNTYNNVSFSDVGISGDSVKCITVTGSGRTTKFFIADNGDVYVLAKNLLYKLNS